MFDELIGEKIIVLVSSNSGCGVATSAGPISINGVIEISGELIKIEKDFLILKDTSTILPNNFGYSNFGDNINKYIHSINVDTMYINVKNIIFIGR